MGESIWSWSTTAATNATADSSIGWAEGQSPGSVNNSARSMMAATAKFIDDTSGALTLAGGTTAYTLTTNQGLATLADGVRIHAVVNATNTGASTLAVDGLTAKAIRKITAGSTNDVAIVDSDLRANQHAIFQYDASANSAAGAWILINPLAVVAFSAHKNGSNQTAVTAATDTQVTFGTELFDIGSCFASNAWTPPAGTATISANVQFTSANSTDGGLHYVRLVKNGSLHQVGTAVRNGAANTCAVHGNWVVSTNGTDAWTIEINAAGSGDRTIDGTATVTWFSGALLR